MLLAEGIELGAFQIKHTDAAIFDEHRDHEPERASATRLM